MDVMNNNKKLVPRYHHLVWKFISIGMLIYIMTIQTCEIQHKWYYPLIMSLLIIIIMVIVELIVNKMKGEKDHE